MKEKWQKLERWLAANAPKVLEPLNPPASEAKIAATEAEIGMSLPPSVRDSYEVHNGEKNVWGLFATWQFLPLEEVVGTIEEMEQIEAEYTFGDFDTSLMIPILRSGGGDLYYVERSCSGEEIELIEWWHEDRGFPSVGDCEPEGLCLPENSRWTQRAQRSVLNSCTDCYSLNFNIKGCYCSGIGLAFNNP